VRDYVHVSDLAAAHVVALRYLLAGGATTALNLGTGTGHSVRELLGAVERITGRPLAVRAQPRRPGDPPRLVADTASAARVLGWRARHPTLDEIVGTAVRWHSGNPG
jgi:UDP-glucose 4-epimerase